MPTQLSEALSAAAIAVAANRTSDIQLIERAISAVPGLVRNLGLGRFRGLVVVDHKPRLLLRFSVRSTSSLRARLGSSIVLKIYGDADRGEGPLLSEWASRGLPVPKSEYGFVGDAAWIAMEAVGMEQLAAHSNEERISATEELAALGPLMHAELTIYAASKLRYLGDVMAPRYEQAGGALASVGYRVPAARWLSALRSFGSSSGVPLHGDLGLPNIARDRVNGQLVVFDPSALLGPYEFDAIRWAARSCSSSLGPYAVLDSWRQHEDLDLTSRRVYETLIAELLYEAGSLEIVNQRHQRSGRTPPDGVLRRRDELLGLVRDV